MIYGYARVSTKDQNLARQIAELQKYTNNIYMDKESGKDFERENYKKLIRKLKKGDLLIIKSIDRLGRDYDLILEEWQRITKSIGADIKVIDMPLLDTTQSDGLIGKFVSDIVLQILSFVAEQERNGIRQRQAEGIRLAKLRGVKFGRPKVDRKPVFELIKKYYAGEINSFEEIIEVSDISRPTFFTMLKEFKKEINK